MLGITKIYRRSLTLIKRQSKFLYISEQIKCFNKRIQYALGYQQIKNELGVLEEGKAIDGIQISRSCIVAMSNVRGDVLG